MRVIGPFQISESDWQGSTTLTRRDIGRWALLVQGCYQFFRSYTDALTCKRECEAPDVRLQMMVHEIGHRGQEVDPMAWREFRRRHLGKLDEF